MALLKNATVPTIRWNRTHYSAEPYPEIGGTVPKNRWNFLGLENYFYANDLLFTLFNDLVLTSIV